MNVYFVLFLQSLMSSGTHLVAKVVVNDIDPVTLTVLRTCIASGALFAIARFRKTSFSFPREDWQKLAMLGFLVIPLNQYLFLAGIKHTTAANAALLYATTPALVLLISAITGNEKLTPLKSLGVVTAFCGIVLVVFERGIDFRSDYTFGNLVICVSVVGWALYSIHGKPLIMKHGAFRTSAATTMIGTFLFLPFGLYNASHFNYEVLTSPDWAGLLYLALIQSVLSYLLWYYALKRTDPSKAAIFNNLQPVMTTILAVVLLGQVVTHIFLLGGTRALAGVILTQFG